MKIFEPKLKIIFEQRREL